MTFKCWHLFHRVCVNFGNRVTAGGDDPVVLARSSTCPSSFSPRQWGQRCGEACSRWQDNPCGCVQMDSWRRCPRCLAETAIEYENIIYSNCITFDIVCCCSCLILFCEASCWPGSVAWAACRWEACFWDACSCWLYMTFV
jgi:hypothetical protein